mgnify:CR=1 FL=1
MLCLQTAVVRQKAELNSTCLVRINCSGDTTVEQLFVCVMPRYINNRRTFDWVQGVLLRALLAGHWILLDEINLLPPHVLEALMPLLDGSAAKNGFSVPGQSGLPPVSLKNIRIFATMNPAAEGGGRSSLSRSFKNLFTVVQLGGQEHKELLDISMKLFKNLLDSKILLPSHVEQLFQVYTKVEELVDRGQVQGASRKQKFNLRDLAAIKDVIEGNVRTQISHYQLMTACDNDQAEQPDFDSAPVVTLVMREALQLVFKHRFESKEAQGQIQEAIDAIVAPPQIAKDQEAASIDADRKSVV